MGRPIQGPGRFQGKVRTHECQTKRRIPRALGQHPTKTLSIPPRRRTIPTQPGASGPTEPNRIRMELTKATKDEVKYTPWILHTQTQSKLMDVWHSVLFLPEKTGMLMKSTADLD
mmetsp:Transcript_16525/g.30067  ORF Transcript_16525/g.30067 Transcript_16525/m.30067 type:complete len:115 (+) Transcript_16525:467-811(+)